ncbi:MAG: PilT/PilU family type 4a pilus ATPase [Candidatus Manganitrophus sp. SA1]|nr:PilT/PilU family type 4a pilus ATPase [Candidatus Manganitrophus morganii]
MEAFKQAFEQLLKQCVEMGGSDLHLSAEITPVVRRNGRLEPLPVGPEQILPLEKMMKAIMNPRQRAVFEQEQTLDLAYSLPTRERFRIHLYRERGRMATAIRQLDNRLRSFEELSLPPQLKSLAELRDGLVLITGPTGSGKTTTLATQIHQINQTRRCHILTVEDPVEYLHQNIQSLVRQRELYTDVPTFAQAVRAALREDPDVILIGEMRDVETTRAAITAAETGHLVFSTLHTGDTVGALDRMIGLFPGSEQESIRHQLSMVLRAVVAQRLLPNRLGSGRLPAVEILRVTPAIAHLIRTGRPQQVYSAIETGSAYGMQTFEQSLAELIRHDLVAPEEARALARDWRTVEAYLRGRGITGSGKRGI